LFALPSMVPLQEAADRDFNAYVVSRHDDLDKLFLFDRDALNAPGTRFDLADRQPDGPRVRLARDMR
jgi:hypothetical protein